MTLRAGVPDAAGLVAEAAEELARRNPGVPLIAGIAAHVRGLCTADIEALRNAVELLDPGEGPLTTALAHEDLGHELRRTGKKDDAVTSFDVAYSLDLAANAHRDLIRVRSALHSLGVRRRQSAVARPQRGWASLTNAELAVCRLVAQGSTNREAAAQLFVSAETVNTHLRHAFTKLGVHSRVELGRAYAKDHATPRSSSPS
jgi:DNA-binding CsgD family transcriptional regulator